MYNASLHIKFFWVDDYYISGILTRSVSATYLKLNKIYIVNQNLVERTFMNKKTDYASFGHIPDKINMMYKIWKVLLVNQIKKYPSLFVNNTDFLAKQDFLYIKNFRWSADLWLPYLKNDDFLNYHDID